MISGRVLGVICGGLLAVPQPGLGAQTSPDSARLARDCRKAVRTVERGMSTISDAWAWSVIVACGPEGGQAVAKAWGMLRNEENVDTLQEVSERIASLRDSALFTSAYAVAADHRAAPSSRVFSFMLMLIQFLERTPLDYPEFSGTPEFEVCRIGAVFGVSVKVGTPLPADSRTRLHALAQSSMRDPNLDERVRSAARCVDQELSTDDRLRLREPRRLP